MGGVPLFRLHAFALVLEKGVVCADNLFVKDTRSARTSLLGLSSGLAPSISLKLLHFMLLWDHVFFIRPRAQFLKTAS